MRKYMLQNRVGKTITKKCHVLPLPLKESLGEESGGLEVEIHKSCAQIPLQYKDQVFSFLNPYLLMKSGLRLPSECLETGPSKRMPL